MYVKSRFSRSTPPNAEDTGADKFDSKETLKKIEKFSFNEAEWWATLVGYCVTLFLLVSLGFAIAGRWDDYLRHLESNAPAWVQAIGSVVAIIGAFRIMNSQATEQRARDMEAKREARLHRLDVCAAILTLGHDKCEYCLEIFRHLEIPPAAPMVETFEELLSMFDQLPLLEVPDPYLVRQLPSLRRATMRLVDSLTILANSPNASAANEARTMLSNAEMWFAKSTAHCSQLLARTSTSEELKLRKASVADYRDQAGRSVIGSVTYGSQTPR